MATMERKEMKTKKNDRIESIITTIAVGAIIALSATAIGWGLWLHFESQSNCGILSVDEKQGVIYVTFRGLSLWYGWLAPDGKIVWLDDAAFLYDEGSHAGVACFHLIEGVERAYFRWSDQKAFVVYPDGMRMVIDLVRNYVNYLPVPQGYTPVVAVRKRVEEAVSLWNVSGRGGS